MTPTLVTLDPERLEQLADLVAERLSQMMSAFITYTQPTSIGDPMLVSHHPVHALDGGDTTHTPLASASQKEAPGLVNAATLARLLGTSRRYVYEHSAELGAIRLGKGEKAPLRFDPDAALAAMGCCVGERSQADIPSGGGQSEHPSPRKPVRLPTRVPKPGSVLAIRGRTGSGHETGTSLRPDLKEAA
jgi:hypothetical protein